MSDKPETKLISEGRMSDEHFGVVNTPVYRASTILYPNLAAIRANKQPYTYGRRGTPSTQSFEDAISSLEGAARTVWSLQASRPSGWPFCRCAAPAIIS